MVPLQARDGFHHTNDHNEEHWYYHANVGNKYVYPLKASRCAAPLRSLKAKADLLRR
jgi:hypothetical protein